MKQSQLSQRLESVRQEMSYSAGGVDDLIENAEDTTVESSRLASDDLAQYVLIKGSLDKEDKEDTDAATNEAKAAEEDDDAEDEEWKPQRTSSQRRMDDQFVIRKIERDRNAGRRFAPVCEVKLSSSGSSSDEEDEEEVNIRRSNVRSGNVKFISSSDEDDFSTQHGTASPADVTLSTHESSVDIGNSTTMTGTTSLEDKRKLPPPEDVIEAKRRKSDESSADSILADEPDQEVKSALVLTGDSDADRAMLASPLAAETPILDMQPITAPCENGSSDIPTHERASDKQDELGSEAESRNKEINAETGEVCYKEPVNGQ